MANLGFFTPIQFANQHKTFSQRLVETVDSYFYLGGRKAYVIPGHAQGRSEGIIFEDDTALFVTTTLKVISYLTLVIPAVMLIAKALLRSSYNFHLLDVQQKLEEGISISPVTIDKIQALLSKIQSGQSDSDIEWHGNLNFLVFSLKSVPGLIFKTAPFGTSVMRAGQPMYSEQRSEHRFSNMVKAKEICLAHQLNLLVIPHAKKFTVDKTTFIAEERIAINQNESAHENLYQLSGLNETAKQLAIFVAKTAFSDVEWRNIPLLDIDPGFQGNRRVALIDLEEMEGAATGFFGGTRRGLVRCFYSEEQMNIVLAEARYYNIQSQGVTPEQIKATRMAEIKADQELHQFYEKNGILKNPGKHIQVDDLTSLGLDLNEKKELLVPHFVRNGSDGESRLEVRWQSFTLGEVVIDVINHINTAMDKNSDKISAKLKRNLLLGTHQGALLHYHWLRRIINALVAKGHLFKLILSNAHGYSIQA